MIQQERLICQDCKRDEDERKVFSVSTYQSIDERYEFPYEYKNKALCVNCAKEGYLTQGFAVSKHLVSIDYHYTNNDFSDVVNLSGTSLILRIKEGMYILKYEDTYCISPDLNADDYVSENAYWEAIDNGRKEVPISIMVLINGKSIIGKGSKQFRTLIQEIIEDFEQ